MTAGKHYSTDNSEQLSENSSSVPTMSFLSKQTASVELPPSLFHSISSNLTADVGIFFTVYRTASLFPISESSGVIMVSPLVIGVTVAMGQQIRNLNDPVVLNFSLPNTVSDFSRK